MPRTKTGKYLAYLRIKDENILATPVHLRVWQQSGSPKGELIEYTERGTTVAQSAGRKRPPFTEPFTAAWRIFPDAPPNICWQSLFVMT